MVLDCLLVEISLECSCENLPHDLYTRLLGWIVDGVFGLLRADVNVLALVASI